MKIASFMLAITALGLTPAMTEAISETGATHHAKHPHHEAHPDHHSPRIDHYRAATPENTAEALEMLKSQTSLIASLIGANKLDNHALEAIHEASYGLEAAVDHLRGQADGQQQGRLDDLDEVVQALHYASENHEAAKTREWFAKLTLAAKKVDHAFQ